MCARMYPSSFSTPKNLRHLMMITFFYHSSPCVHSTGVIGKLYVPCPSAFHLIRVVTPHIIADEHSSWTGIPIPSLCLSTIASRSATPPSLVEGLSDLLLGRSPVPAIRKPRQTSCSWTWRRRSMKMLSRYEH
jgi:hypothetical protein